LLISMTKVKNFAIIGVAGYIAPRHLEAIKATGNRLVVAYDPHDSVGILDKYGDDIDFFTEFERFDRYAEKHKRDPMSAKKIDYVSICSPNYLHDAHIRFGLRIGANVICEKPIVLNHWNIDPILELEKESGKKVSTVLQLRLHPAILALKEKIQNEPLDHKYDIRLTYITPRGNWYYNSWKGDMNKSGGVATNIGIHFFDMLIWIFGDVANQEVYAHDDKKAAGYIELKRASVKWFLSIDKEDMPHGRKEKGGAFRSITVDGQEINFSEGFTDLHIRVYEKILAGEGFGLNDARASIQLAHDIRTAPVIGYSYKTILSETSEKTQVS